MMKSKERTEILSEIPVDELKQWTGLIETIGVIKKMKEPTISMTMLRASDSVEGEVFNAGELLVSEATIMIDEGIGYGMVLGNDLIKAEALAMIDAACQSDDRKWASFLNQLNQWLEEQKKEQELQKRIRFAQTKRSHVQFDLLEEE